MSVTPLLSRPETRSLRVVQLITKQDLGGAQLTAIDAAVHTGDEIQVALWVGADDGSAGEFRRVATERGVRPDEVPSLRRHISPIADLRAIATLTRRLRRERPHVLHTHSSKAGVLGRIAARMAGIPVVHTVHGWSFHDDMSWWAFRGAVSLERFLARWSATLVVVTGEDRELGLRHRIGLPTQYQVIRSGLRLDLLRTDPARGELLRAELGIDGDVQLVGTVGRCAPQKDPHLLLDAFDVLAERNDHVRLIMVGDGPQHAEIRDRVASSTPRPSAGRVHVLGARTDAVEIIDALDVFVLTSRWEGLPRTVIEAMALRTPVAAVGVNGVSEVLADGVTGFLSTSRDSRAVADAIERALAVEVAILDAAEATASDFGVEEMQRALHDLWRAVATSHGSSR